MGDGRRLGVPAFNSARCLVFASNVYRQAFLRETLDGRRETPGRATP